MVDLETILTITSMTYIVDLDAYELYPGMEKSSTILLMSAKVLHDTYDRGKSIIQKYIYILYINNYI